MPLPPPSAEAGERKIVFATLGGIDLARGDGTTVQSVLSQPRRVALLAYLAAARPAGHHSRDELIALFWPERSDRKARDVLNTNLSALRRSLGSDAIVSRGNESVALNPDVVRADVRAFRTAIERGRPAEALELYRGPFLPAFHLSDSRAFERWLEGERRHLERATTRAAIGLAEAAVADGDLTRALRFAELAVEAAPRSEEALRRLMDVLDRRGNRTGALRRYEAFAARIEAELGTEPSPETRRVIDRIRHRDEQATEVPAAAPEAGAPAAVTASGARDAAPASAAGDARSAEGRTVGPASPARRRLAVSGLALASIALVFLVLSGLLAGPGYDESVGDRVVVFPFQARGAGADYLREGMVDLLAAKLDRVGPVHAVSPRVVLRAAGDGGTLDIDEARGIARRLGANRLILGSVTSVDGALRVDAELFDGDGPRAAVRASVQGAESELFDLVDELARRLLAEQLMAAGQHLAGVGASTSRSVEALRPYLSGERRFRAGDYRGAMESYRQAVAADSTFALARYKLSSAAAWAGEHALARAEAERAEQLADGLPEAESRLMRAWYAYLLGYGDEAEQIYRSIVTANPTDVEAWYRLGEVLFHYGPTRARPLAQARNAFESVVELEPDHVISVVHLGRLAAVEGDSVRLAELIRTLGDLDPSPAQRLELTVLDAVLREDSATLAALTSSGGKLAEADAHLRETVIRSVAAFTGDLETAARMAAAITRDSDPTDRRESALLLRAHFAAGLGHWGEAMRRLDELAALAPGLARSHRRVLATRPFVSLDTTTYRRLAQGLLDGADAALDADSAGTPRPAHTVWEPPLEQGLLMVELGRTAEAEALARRLETSDLPYGRQLARLLRARMAEADGDLEGALVALGPPELLALHILPDIRHYPKAAERYLRGTLLQRLGRYDDALAWFASFPDPSGYDVAYLAAAHLHRAQIHERRGEAEAALRHYTRTLDYWHDAEAPFAATRQEAVDGLRRLQDGR